MLQEEGVLSEFLWFRVVTLIETIFFLIHYL